MEEKKTGLDGALRRLKCKRDLKIERYSFACFLGLKNKNLMYVAMLVINQINYDVLDENT
jgi:hypothetical protein